MSLKYFVVPPCCHETDYHETDYTKYQQRLFYSDMLDTLNYQITTTAYTMTQLKLHTVYQRKQQKNLHKHHVV